MNPIQFPEQNHIFKKPSSMTDEECGSLPCFADGQQIISKWELTEEEKTHIAEHGFIWVRVFGQTMPPILPQACETVFKTVNDGEMLSDEMNRIMEKGTE